MKKNRQRQLAQIAAALATLSVLTSARAITQPIRTQHGVVRLGSKTQANVDANHSSVAMRQGMVLVSSNPGGLGRATVKVSFGGAPMVASVQGTAVIAFLPGKFIEITEVEGRTYLTREGKLGEKEAIDAGKMLLVEPTANRLPNTVDINLDHFVKNSPMLNGGNDLGASPLITRSIHKQAANRYLKPTPLYFNGAGTEALVDIGKQKTQSSSSYQNQPLDTSLEALEVLEQLPRRTASDVLVASLNNSNSISATSESPSRQPPSEQPPSEQPPSEQPPSEQPPSEQPPSEQPPSEQPPLVVAPLPVITQSSGIDVPGGPAQQYVATNANTDVPPSRGLLIQFNHSVSTYWFPIDFSKGASQDWNEITRGG